MFFLYPDAISLFRVKARLCLLLVVWLFGCLLCITCEGRDCSGEVCCRYLLCIIYARDSIDIGACFECSG